MGASSIGQPNNTPYVRQLYNKPPFCLLNKTCLDQWLDDSKLIKVNPGETIISPKNLQNRIYLVLDGVVRFLTTDESGDVHTIGKRGSGQLIGWVSLLRTESCEWISASEKTLVLGLSASLFIKFICEDSNFRNWFGNLSQPQESFYIANAAINLLPKRPSNWREVIDKFVENAKVVSVEDNESFNLSGIEDFKGYTWHLSTPGINGHQLVLLLIQGDFIYQY